MNNELFCCRCGTLKRPEHTRTKAKGSRTLIAFCHNIGVWYTISPCWKQFLKNLRSSLKKGENPLNTFRKGQKKLLNPAYGPTRSKMEKETKRKRGVQLLVDWVRMGRTIIIWFLVQKSWIWADQFTVRFSPVRSVFYVDPLANCFGFSGKKIGLCPGNSCPTRTVE